MRILKGQLCDLYEALHQGGVWTTTELCKVLGFPEDFYSRERVRSLIGQLRKKCRQSAIEFDNPWMFQNGDRLEVLLWIGTDFGGYTLIKNASVRAFECRMRAGQSINIALNGAPAFLDLKRLAPKAFATLSIDIKPRLLRMNRLVNK